MASGESGYERVSNPIDLVEQLAASHDWTCDRASNDELTLVVAGTWTDYHVSLNWRDDLQALHLACAFDFKVPSNRLNEMYRLVAQINEQLWLGHFDLWTQEGLIMFRHALLLNGSTEVAVDHHGIPGLRWYGGYKGGPGTWGSHVHAELRDPNMRT